MRWQRGGATASVSCCGVNGHVQRRLLCAHCWRRVAASCTARCNQRGRCSHDAAQRRHRGDASRQLRNRAGQGPGTAVADLARFCDKTALQLEPFKLTALADRDRTALNRAVERVSATTRLGGARSSSSARDCCGCACACSWRRSKCTSSRSTPNAISFVRERKCLTLAISRSREPKYLEVEHAF